MPNTIRHLAALLAASLLCACGGGGPTPTIDFWGDSITSGALVGGQLAVSPVTRINQAGQGRYSAIDHAQSGMTTADALAGGFGGVTAFAGYVLTTPADKVVLRFGTADAIRPVAPDLFRQNLRELIRLTRQAGKTPVLVEPIWQTRFAAPADELSAIVHQIAESERVELIPVRDLPWALADGVHPDQATADRMAARIADYIKEP